MTEYNDLVLKAAAELIAHVRVTNAKLASCKAELNRANASITGLQDQIRKLLTMIDEWDKEELSVRTMHNYGQTPYWYVEAAHWATYGTAPPKSG